MGDWVLFRGGIFLLVMVGGGGVVVGSKELVGWVDSVTDVRSYPPPVPWEERLKR